MSDPRLLRRYRELIAEDEQERIDQYRFAKDRLVSLVAWGMVRCLLSRYAAVEPSDWRFRSNRYGRPEIAKPGHAGTLRFNIAHTEGMIVILISEGREVGVDVESLPYLGPCLEIADRHFSPSEAEQLRSLPSSEQTLRFIEFWTLKESFVKARGMGLALPLDEVSFRIERRPRSARWQFNLYAIGEKHVAATTIERHSTERLQLLRREMVAAVD
jgi:4'-phosphopantetheinyl transferase